MDYVEHSTIRFSYDTHNLRPCKVPSRSVLKSSDLLIYFTILQERDGENDFLYDTDANEEDFSDESQTFEARNFKTLKISL